MLKAENIAKSYTNRLLFKKVNFEILPQSIHLLQGANGTGKSTLFKIIAGLISADFGEIDTNLKQEELGYLAHATFLYPQLSALENLRFWHTLHTKKSFTQKEYLNTLDEVGLARFAHAEVRIFSRGMAQKLNIARLLIQKPRLLLLDEPSTGLDTEAKTFLLTQIQKAKAEGSSVFWISHDIEKDKEYADFLHILENKTLQSTHLSKKEEEVHYA